MKKYISLFGALALIISLTGCAADKSSITSNSETVVSEIINAENETSSSESSGVRPDTVFMSWSEEDQITLEDAISESNCVVRAKHVSFDEFDEYVDYRFHLIDIYKGSADDEIIIRWGKEFSDETERVFDEGEYILPLKYVNSVYYDYPYYNVVGHIVIPCSTDGGIQAVAVDGVMAEAPSELSSVDKAAALVASVEDTSEIFFKDYIHSDVPEEIAEGSEYIVKAVVNDDPSRTGSDRGIYNCDIIESYKGDVPDSIQVLLFYDSVESGGEYYLFLSKNEKSVYYTISSKNSVYSADNAEISRVVSATLGNSADIS